MVKAYFSTEDGELFVGDTAALVRDQSILNKYAGKCDLIFFSPPYSLVKQKSYKNKVSDEYVRWMKSFAKPMKKLLSPKGSIVIEIGNAWNAGSPTMATTPLEALLAFKESADLHLCQEFIWHNPARLPSPAQWVTIERIRVKDSYTRIWWMSATERPKADNRRVLKAYSKSMNELHRKQKFNAGKRPSGHVVSKDAFLTNNGGAIPSSAMIDETPSSFISLSNTRSEKEYRDYCLKHSLPQHPARMPAELARFFISFLTDAGDLVLDPFAGSNTTGWVASDMGRQWLSFEISSDYAQGSTVRFLKPASEGVDVAPSAGLHA